MNSKTASFCLFLLGAFSMTQIHIVGNIGISEFVLFLVAPFVFMQDYKILKYDKFMTAVWLALAACCGCVVASFVNNTPFSLFLRGFASPYAVFSVLVVGHRLVRQSPGGYKWLCLGLGLTWIINIFVFQRGVEADAYAEGARGLAAVDGVMSGTLFWVTRLNAILKIPIAGWYMQTPILYSIFAPLFMFFFAALTTASGRSAAAGAFGSALLVILGGKKRRKMKRLSMNFWLLLVMGVLFAQGLTMAYKAAALSGVMGEKALLKYETQMKGRKGGIIATLMGGRIEFFSGLYAALQKPIIGYGNRALDVKDYYGQFLSKYGTADDWEEYVGRQRWAQASGHSYVRGIMAHSHIIEAWIKHGIAGLLFWIYVLFQFTRYFRRDLATVPQWFGMLAVAAPSALWAIFFSPFGDRIGMSMILVYILMARAIRLGYVRLPIEMILEIERNDK